MPLISFKETSMLLLGFVLVYSLYYLRTHEPVFGPPTVSSADPITVTQQPTQLPEEDPKALPTAVLEEVEIPDWLSNKADFDLGNLTIDDLLELARLSHEQDHDFFPDNQNTLFYLLKAKELGVEDTAIEELMTTVHASLYDQAEQASRNHDATTLTALTARLRTIDAADPKIQAYTERISVIVTLNRLQEEIESHLANGRLYEDDQRDALHTLIVATNMDADFPALIELKNQVLSALSDQALRAAQELDFSFANQHIEWMQELDGEHPITRQAITDIQKQRQNRFAYLDQQFYSAINDLNLDRAANMLAALAALDVPSSQLNDYESLLDKTRQYGRHDIGDEFNDLLNIGNQTGPTMVVMPMGEYFMGNQTGPKHQRPSHLVRIGYGFAVSKYEITVADFARFIDASGYQTTAEKNNRAVIYDERTGRFKDKFNINWRHDYLGKLADGNLPVIHVSWEDASTYANWLNATTGGAYRLLSESEFEYLLSANNNTLYPWGNDEPTEIWGNFSGAKDKFKRSRIRWREGFTDYEDGYWGPAPVGSFIQTLLGLYDLSGNVMEWVDDCWHDSYTRAPNDGSSWVNRGCENRVIRGGNWGSANEEYQIHHRLKAATDFTDPRLGFRVAKTLRF